MKCLLLENSISDQEAQEAAFAVLRITRKEIEAGLVGGTVDRLMRLSDSPVLTRHFTGGMVFEVIGYDDDPRELYEIAKCRHFFQQLAVAWPYWFHFMEPDIALPTLLLLLAGVTAVERRADEIGAEMNAVSLALIMQQLFRGMNGLHALHGFASQENRAITERIVAAMDRAQKGED